MRKMITAVALVAMAAAVGARVVAPAPADHTTIDDIRGKLLGLSYYDVFDFLAFNYENGTVTLSGYANQPLLEADAERAVNERTVETHK